MIISLETTIVKREALFEALQDYVCDMAESKEAAHVVEKGIWDQLLALGQALMSEYFSRAGDGDTGDFLGLGDGRRLARMGLHTRRYVSVFGEIAVSRMCYGDGKIEACPLDAALQLPGRDYSYLLQDWSQRFCVEQAYGQSSRSLSALLPVEPTVRTLERINLEASESVAGFHENQDTPPLEQEAAFVVAAVDGKGVPLCRDEQAADSKRHRRKKGQKKNKKKMACVSAVYTIDPFIRDAQDVVDELMQKTAQQRRPRPVNKRVQAHLIEGKDGAFTFVKAQIDTRNPTGEKPVIVLADGERAIWKKADEYLPGAICILDLFHVMEKLWQAAHLFHEEGSDKAEEFVTHRLRMLLAGKVAGLIQGLGQMRTKHRLKGKKKETVAQIIGYFKRNKRRMQYDQYLARGYPIGSGVVEGACRHLVKDRMERTGMRWRIPGAQAMLDVRAVYLNDQWDSFWDYHIENQQHQLYGHMNPPIDGQLQNAA